MFYNFLFKPHFLATSVKPCDVFLKSQATIFDFVRHGRVGGRRNECVRADWILPPPQLILSCTLKEKIRGFSFSSSVIVFKKFYGPVTSMTLVMMLFGVPNCEFLYFVERLIRKAFAQESELYLVFI